MIFAYENRNNIRKNCDTLLEPEFICIKTPTKKINFGILKNFKNLFLHHLQKNPNIVLNKSNIKPKQDSNYISDFRQCTHFKNEFLDLLNNGDNLLLFNIYMDGTNINDKESFNIYLNFVNDNLEKNNNKYIYNLCFIKKEDLNIIGLNKYLEFIFNRLKELENGFV